jgi:hypothetical protein
MWRASLSTRPRVPLAVSLVTLAVAALLPGALGFLSPFASLPRTCLSSATLYTLRNAAPAAMRHQCVAVLAAEGTNAPGEPAGAAPVPTRPLVICGPSGVGKGTLIELLRQEFAEDIGFCVRPRACARARTRPRTPPERATRARTPSNRPADARAPTPGLAHDARPAPRGGPRAALLVHRRRDNASPGDTGPARAPARGARRAEERPARRAAAPRGRRAAPRRAACVTVLRRRRLPRGSSRRATRCALRPPAARPGPPRRCNGRDDRAASRIRAAKCRV